MSFHLGLNFLGLIHPPPLKGAVFAVSRKLAAISEKPQEGKAREEREREREIKRGEEGRKERKERPSPWPRGGERGRGSRLSNVENGRRNERE